MSSSIHNPLLNQGNINRDDLLTILSVGFRKKEYRFVRQLVLNWLAAFPGDLYFNYLYAKSLVEDGKPQQSIPILDMICSIDPDFLQAHELRLSAHAQIGKDTSTDAGYIYAIAGKKVAGTSIPAWAESYHEGQDSFENEKLEDAELLIQQALISDQKVDLSACFHLQIASVLHDTQTLANLANLYHSRWADCLPITLYLAAAKLNLGEDTEAVALLHQCAAKDTAGQVIQRIWGENHPYRMLYPDQMQIRFDISVPATIVAALGWNQLPFSTQTAPSQERVEPVIPQDPIVEEIESEPVVVETILPESDPELTYTPPLDELENEIQYEAPVKVEEPEVMVAFEEVDDYVEEKLGPESLQDVRQELERIASRLRMTGVTRTDGRFPTYVVLTTRKGLENQYGSQTGFILDELMKQVVEAIRKKQGWNALIFYVDDPACTTTFGIKPAPYNDPWKIKLAVADLDKALGKRGEMIGALLIVGGPEIVPFHHLPNPTDDADTEIASDNPYATLDDNYFIPEWPIGRLPGGTNRDAGLLLQYLRKMITYHSAQSSQEPWWQRVSVFSPIWMGMRRVFAHGVVNTRPAFGYSAAVWNQASLEVFRQVGDGQSMLSSPPTKTGELIGNGYLPARLQYFNLHGVTDAPEWYGQSDYNDLKDNPEYPVALSPQDILNDGNPPVVVCSEACYGAYIEGKNENEALSLKFLSTGTKSFVGSTCVSYGSVSAPLIGADQLASQFWKAIKEGAPAGEALRNAKVQMAQEMTRRQGYLDGEDQKTLISFVLYGDPMFSITQNKMNKKGITRNRIKEKLLTVCETEEKQDVLNQMDQETMAHVKLIVEQYLPGLRDANYSVSKQIASRVQNGDNRNKSTQPLDEKRTVVTVSKAYSVSRTKHYHYARLTIDPKGKVIKLTVSR